MSILNNNVKSAADAIHISIGVPSPIMQLLNGQVVERLLTLESVDDFSKTSKSHKMEIIRKVMVVGLMTLGVGCAVALMSPLAIWAVPLSMVVIMGLSFNLLTMQKQQAHELIVRNWGIGHKLGN